MKSPDLAELGRRTTAFHKWMQRRQEIGTTAAARELGYSVEIMFRTARRLGVEIPKLTCAIGNVAQIKSFRPDITKTQEARAAAMPAFIELREKMGVDAAARKLGFTANQMARAARLMGITLKPLNHRRLSQVP